jgi:predicted nuclease of predicted toxin-antitoxin system
LRILFDKNVPVGVRRFLSKHQVRTVVDLKWHPQIENGDRLNAAEAAGFDVMITADQNLRYQQNLTGRKLSLVVLGSNIWPIVQKHREAITAKVDEATPRKLRLHRDAASAKRQSLSPATARHW